MERRGFLKACGAAVAAAVAGVKVALGGKSPGVNPADQITSNYGRRWPYTDRRCNAPTGIPEGTEWIRSDVCKRYAIIDGKKTEIRPGERIRMDASGRYRIEVV